jgi:hypothetical protein
MMTIAELHASLASVGIPVVGVAYYPDPEMRHQHVPAAPAWWYVAEDYAVRVDHSPAMSVDDAATASGIISTWRAENA